MGKTISITGNTTKVMTDLQRKAYQLSKECGDKLCKNLGEYGKTYAEAGYIGVMSEDDTLPDVEYDENKRELTAKGEDVMFLEFGAGLFQTKTNPKAGEFGAYPTSYSVEHGQWLTDPEKMKIAAALGHEKEWPIPDESGEYTSLKNAKWTKGNEPGEGMYNAGKMMRDHIKEAWEEVSNDRH